MDRSNKSLENFQGPYRKSDAEPPVVWRSVSTNCPARPYVYSTFKYLLYLSGAIILRKQTGYCFFPSQQCTNNLCVYRKSVSNATQFDHSSCQEHDALLQVFRLAPSDCCLYKFGASASSPSLLCLLISFLCSHLHLFFSTRGIRLGDSQAPRPLRCTFACLLPLALAHLS